MQFLRRLPAPLVILVTSIFAALACSTSMQGANRPDVDRVLRSAGLSGGYWHEEISDAGKDSQSQSWIVSAFDAPIDEGKGICVARGNTWVLREEFGVAKKTTPKSSEKTLLMHISAQPSEICGKVSADQYFLVEPAVNYAEASSLVLDIDTSIPCLRTVAHCSGWDEIDIGSDATKRELQDFDQLRPFLFETSDDGTIELTYRYSTMTSEDNFLVFTVTRDTSGGRNLRIGLKPFEAE